MEVQRRFDWKAAVSTWTCCCKAQTLACKLLILAVELRSSVSTCRTRAFFRARR